MSSHSDASRLAREKTLPRGPSWFRCHAYAHASTRGSRRAMAENLRATRQHIAVRRLAGKDLPCGFRQRLGRRGTGRGRLAARPFLQRLTAEDGSGHISVTFSPSAPRDLVAEIRNGSGGVSVVMPPGFAGASTVGSPRESSSSCACISTIFTLAHLLSVVGPPSIQDSRTAGTSN